MPNTQNSVAEHWLPQAPQLFGSNEVLMQAPLHKVSPFWQTHWPATQPEVAEVPGQRLPQAPQLARSDWRFLQTPLQRPQPTWHEHWPATQN